LSQDLIRRCETAIHEATGYRVQLLEKSLAPTQEDLLKYWGEKAIQKIKDVELKQIYLLSRAGKGLSAMRRDGWVMTPHATVRGAYVQHMEADAFINDVTKDYPNIRGAVMTRIKMWFTNLDHVNFPLITPGKLRTDVISFNNGYIALDEIDFDEKKGFYPWAEVEEAPLTDHFFECDFTFDRGETPLWDQLLALQLTDEVVVPGKLTTIQTLEVLVGRLFYVVGAHDNWQVSVLLKGDANTGKSSIIDLVCRMFPKISIGVITSTIEKKFGLESLYQKRLVVIPDMPEDFKALIDQSNFQSMCTGEGVSVARKYTSAVVDKKWTAPIIAAGNLNYNYKDTSGSISRRVVMFPFMNLVETRNTEMVPTIVRTELVYVMLRCIAEYRRVAKEHRGRDFWKVVAADRLRETQLEQADTNPLSAFLVNGDNYYQVLFEEGALTPLSELNAAFSNHMKFTHKIDKAKIGGEHYPIKAAGYLMKKGSICKHCHGHHSVVTCGDHYDKKNVYRPETIVNMKILKIGAYKSE
jgi:hypothetical protein